MIPIDSPHLLDVKYAEIGKYSGAYGQAKFSKFNNHSNERKHALNQDSTADNDLH